MRCAASWRALDFAETASYIAGRLRIAGGEPAAIFSREAILAIHEASGGVPRIINVICDNALMGAFAEQTKPIVRSMVQDVCRDFDLGLTRRNGTAPTDTIPSAAASGEREAEGIPAPVGATPGSPERKRRFSFF